MAVSSGQVSVGNATAVLILAAATASPNYSEGATEPNKFIVLTNGAGNILYLGTSTVTSLTGLPIAASGTVSFWLHPDEAVYGIAASGTQTVSYLVTGL